MFKVMVKFFRLIRTFARQTEFNLRRFLFEFWHFIYCPYLYGVSAPESLYILIYNSSG
jgi:hypothetical protein